MMMKRIGAWMLLAFLALVGEWHGRCYGCVEEERVGLLEIKALIDPDGYGFSLRDWVDSSNCCEWSRIECDPTTRRVIQLSLSGERDYNFYGNWVLNASLFQPFKELQSLHLEANGLVGCMENEGFEVLSSNLSNLYLGLNRFNNDKSILSCFNGNLSTLKSLDLSLNELTAGSRSFYGNLLGLKVLSSRLKKLENLHLRSNQYNDSIFPSLNGFSSLKSLDLSYNQLIGSGFEIISSHLGKLENLELSYNIFNDSIFSHLRGFSSLKSLDLSHNQLTRSAGINNKLMPRSFETCCNLLKLRGSEVCHASKATEFGFFESSHFEHSCLAIEASFPLPALSSMSLLHSETGPTLIHTLFN